ncbi:hypothetical protein ADUPG1_000876 [Aduncisulcus paluster]|uniref:Uncharacterized protein n=1 Tax=Aduncisulcus paluster TaxID=2918883 RepID=A0ABQ5KC71_9EUKA|nr:hypothetical protein ADUPG1_000876 [Aduncisulcus paluster]
MSKPKDPLSHKHGKPRSQSANSFHVSRIQKEAIESDIDTLLLYSSLPSLRLFLEKQYRVHPHEVSSFILINPANPRHVLVCVHNPMGSVLHNVRISIPSARSFLEHNLYHTVSHIGPYETHIKIIGISSAMSGASSHEERERKHKKRGRPLSVFASSSFSLFSSMWDTCGMAIGRDLLSRGILDLKLSVSALNSEISYEYDPEAGEKPFYAVYLGHVDSKQKAIDHWWKKSGHLELVSSKSERTNVFVSRIVPKSSHSSSPSFSGKRRFSPIGASSSSTSCTETQKKADCSYVELSPFPFQPVHVPLSIAVSQSMADSAQICISCPGSMRAQINDVVKGTVIRPKKLRDDTKEYGRTQSGRQESVQSNHKHVFSYTFRNELSCDVIVEYLGPSQSSYGCFYHLHEVSRRVLGKIEDKKRRIDASSVDQGSCSPQKSPSSVPWLLSRGRISLKPGECLQCVWNGSLHSSRSPSTLLPMCVVNNNKGRKRSKNGRVILPSTAAPPGCVSYSFESSSACVSVSECPCYCDDSCEDESEECSLTSRGMKDIDCSDISPPISLSQSPPSLIFSSLHTETLLTSSSPLLSLSPRSTALSQTLSSMRDISSSISLKRNSDCIMSGLASSPLGSPSFFSPVGCMNPPKRFGSPSGSDKSQSLTMSDIIEHGPKKLIKELGKVEKRKKTRSIKAYG